MLVVSEINHNRVITALLEYLDLFSATRHWPESVKKGNGWKEGGYGPRAPQPMIYVSGIISQNLVTAIAKS